MDAFALLCNLHGNGPLTLRRLRRAGIHSLEQIASLPAERLALVMAVPKALALRFANEARELARRITTEPLEREDEPIAIAHSVEAAEARRPVPAPQPRPALTKPDAAPTRARARSAAPVAAGPVPVPAPPAERKDRDLNLAEGDSLLAPGLLEGLDRSLCERFVAQGVRTLETLCAMTELSFARTVGIPYTKLIELQYQARRRSRDVIVPAVPPQPRRPVFSRIPSLPPGPPLKAAPKDPWTSEVSGPFV